MTYPLWEISIYLAHFERQHDEQREREMIAQARSRITNPRLRRAFRHR